jgi:hypothetical protein
MVSCLLSRGLDQCASVGFFAGGAGATGAFCAAGDATGVVSASGDFFKFISCLV